MIGWNNLKTRFDDIVWHSELQKLPGWWAWPIRGIRLLWLIIQDLLEGQLTLRAMSLVFTTILSLVPLLAVSFSVLKAFDVHSQIEPMLNHFLEPLGEQGQELSARIIDFVNNVKAGVLGTVSIGLLFFTVISLIQKVETSFNYTWRVARSRSFATRFSSYLSVLMVGPVLVVSAMGMTATFTNKPVVQSLIAIEPFGTLFAIAAWLAPYLLIIAAFTFLYSFIPNTRVHFLAALSGGLVAGILWQTLGWGFAVFVAGSSQYTAIYSSFAIALLFMIWLYLSWLVLLVGASVAFYAQNPEYLLPQSRDFSLSNYHKEKLALQVLSLIGQGHYHNRPPWTADQLVESLQLPKLAIQHVLDALEQYRLITQTDIEPATYLPARPLETTRIKTALDAVRSHSPDVNLMPYNRLQLPNVEHWLQRLDQGMEDVLDGRTLKDLALASPNSQAGTEVDERRSPPCHAARTVPADSTASHTE